MPDYGFGALSIGTGAQAGLQQLLKQRLLEREMALREQSQAQEMDYRNRALDETVESNRLQREALDQYRQAQVALDSERIGATETASAARLTPFKANLPVDTAQNFMARGYPVSGPSPDQLASPLANEEMPPYQFEGNAPEPKSTKLLTPEEYAQQVQLDRDKAKNSLDFRPPSQTGQTSPSQRFNMERTLRREWNTLSQNWRTMKNQVATMEAGLTAAGRGDMAQGAQAILVTFQKILDPTSVVRESEYARSAEGMSAMNQIKGFVDRMSRGGVGVTLPELQKFYTLGKEMVARAGSELPRIRQQFEQNAVEYGLNPRLIIAEDPEQPPASTPPPDATSTGDVVYVRDKDGKLVRKQ